MFSEELVLKPDCGPPQEGFWERAPHVVHNLRGQVMYGGFCAMKKSNPGQGWGQVGERAQKVQVWTSSSKISKS